MNKTRLLLVDSSPSFLAMLESIIDKKEVMIVGRLRNGPEVVKRTQETSPDIIILDLEMPFMNGEETIEQIMAAQPTPILGTITSSDFNRKNVLQKGALEVVEKQLIERMSLVDFTKKIKFLAEITVFAHHRNTTPCQSQPAGDATRRNVYLTQKIISIASSTGGPRAISEILASLPGDTPFPVVIAQHMPEGFTKGMVRWLNTISKIPVKIGEMGERVKRGVVYFAPSEKHMAINEDRCIVLEDHVDSDIFHPSCNRLLTSVAHAYGSNAIAVILTGMGDDGVIGMRRIKDMGGVTIAQDEDSSSLFGMPKEAIASGCIGKTIPLKMIASELKKQFVKQ